MVGIQIGREQEEGEREEDAGFEKIEDFNVPSNAEETFCGSDDDGRVFKLDITLQLGGKENVITWRGSMSLHGGGLCHHTES